MKYLRIEQASGDTFTQVVVVAEDPAAVLRDAARAAEELIDPIPAASEPETAAAAPACVAAPYTSASEQALDFVGQLARELGKALTGRGTSR